MTAASKPKPMIVAGVMSGTSADGVDVALCRIAPGMHTTDSPRIQFLGLGSFPYPKTVRAELLRIMGGTPVTAAEMSRLNWRLGQIYAGCVEKAAAKFGVKVALVGLHGQTIHHEAKPTRYLGSTVRSTWQIGEAAVVAEHLRCPVVSDFRPADLTAGGQGAPLVPMLDYCMFRSNTKNRVLLNLGGIANVTAIPAGTGLDSLLAFDTGPGNMVIDAVMQAEFGRPFDHGGEFATKGRSDGKVVSTLRNRVKYFAEVPPKSCGREQFGPKFVQGLRELCHRGSAADAVATATFLTGATVLEAFESFCWPHLARQAPQAKTTDVIVTGGGVKNATLMKMLTEGFSSFPFGVEVLPSDTFGVGPQAKEGVAFALLAWLSYHGLPGNVPSATGAARPVVLGKVSHG